jgi:hypothetical protein
MLSGVAAEVGQALKNLTNLAEASGSKMGASFLSAGVGMMQAGAMISSAGVLVGAGLFVAANHAANFQSQMILLHTQAGVGAEKIKGLSQAVLEMSPALGVLPLVTLT